LLAFEHTKAISGAALSEQLGNALLINVIWRTAKSGFYSHIRRHQITPSCWVFNPRMYAQIQALSWAQELNGVPSNPNGFLPTP
jgi:hypothetical protein